MCSSRKRSVQVVHLLREILAKVECCLYIVTSDRYGNKTHILSVLAHQVHVDYAYMNQRSFTNIVAMRKVHSSLKNSDRSYINTIQLNSTLHYNIKIKLTSPLVIALLHSSTNVFTSLPTFGKRYLEIPRRILDSFTNSMLSSSSSEPLTMFSSISLLV